MSYKKIIYKSQTDFNQETFDLDNMESSSFNTDNINNLHFYVPEYVVVPIQFTLNKINPQNKMPLLLRSDYYFENG